MNIKLLVVSKTDTPYLQEGIDIYAKRLKHYVNFDIEVIPALKDQRNATPDEIKEREAALLDIRTGDPLIRLREVVYDQKGRPLHNSVQLICGDRFTTHI